MGMDKVGRRQFRMHLFIYCALRQMTSSASRSRVLRGLRSRPLCESADFKLEVFDAKICQGDYSRNLHPTQAEEVRTVDGLWPRRFI
jgi:hypothetical protein